VSAIGWRSHLARKLNQTSEFGAFIDSVADKLLVAVILIMLVTNPASLLPATSLIVARGLLVSALRDWVASQGKRSSVGVAFSGKLKTTVQMVAIGSLLLVTESTPAILWQFGFVLVNIAAILSLYSMFHYYRKAWAVLFPPD